MVLALSLHMSREAVGKWLVLVVLAMGAVSA